MAMFRIWILAAFMISGLPCRAGKADTLSAYMEEERWDDSLSVVIPVEPSAGIEAVFTEKRVTVFSVTGRLLGRNVVWADFKKKLPAGVYVVAHRKFVVR